MPLTKTVMLMVCINETSLGTDHFTIAGFILLPPANELLGQVMFLPAATKLGQGNIFIGVCQEFCSQGEGWWSGPGGGGGLPGGG